MSRSALQGAALLLWSGRAAPFLNKEREQERRSFFSGATPDFVLRNGPKRQGMEDSILGSHGEQIREKESWKWYQTVTDWQSVTVVERGLKGISELDYTFSKLEILKKFYSNQILPNQIHFRKNLSLLNMCNFSNNNFTMYIQAKCERVQRENDQNSTYYLTKLFIT